MNKIIALTTIGLAFGVSAQENSKQAELQKTLKEFNLLMYACLKRGEQQFKKLNQMADSGIAYSDEYIFTEQAFNKLFNSTHEDYLECRAKLEALVNKIKENQQNA